MKRGSGGGGGGEGGCDAAALVRAVGTVLLGLTLIACPSTGCHVGGWGCGTLWGEQVTPRLALSHVCGVPRWDSVGGCVSVCVCVRVCDHQCTHLGT